MKVYVVYDLIDGRILSVHKRREVAVDIVESENIVSRVDIISDNVAYEEFELEE